MAKLHSENRTDRARAKAAAEEARLISEAVPVAAEVAQRRVPVVLGDGCYTDGKTITLPKTEARDRAIKGLAAHEGAHCNLEWGTPDDKDIMEKLMPGNPGLVHFILNCPEDARVNQIVKELDPGFYEMLAEVDTEALTDQASKVIEGITNAARFDTPTAHALLLGAFYRHEGIEDLIDCDATRSGKWLAFCDLANKAYENAEGTGEYATVVQETRNLIAALTDYLGMPPVPRPDDLPTAIAGMPSGLPTSGNPDDGETNGTGLTGDAAEAANKAADGEDITVLVKELGEKDRESRESKAGAHWGKDLIEGHGESSCVKIFEGKAIDGTDDGTHADVLAHHAADIAGIKTVLNSIAQTGAPVRGATTGRRLSTADLAIYMVDHSYTTVFKNDITQRGADVLLLVDQSGSMGGQKIDLVKKAVSEIAEATKNTRIRLGIAGFTTDWCEGKAVVNIFKKLGQAIDPDVIGRLHSQQGNADGVSFRAAANYFFPARVPGTVQFMFVISDGQPTESGTPFVSPMQDLLDAIKEILARGIELFCLSLDDITASKRNDYLGNAYGEMRYDRSAWKYPEFIQKLTGLLRKVVMRVQH